jgi:autotransporter strand-loop-strand O-heptosyltransferase
MKTVYINLLSNSMGDTIASTPYVLEYVKQYKVKVYFGINDAFIFLLKGSYKDIEFIGRNASIEYDEKIELDYIFSKSVQGGYAEQLKFENPKYIRPVINVPESPRVIKNKYVAIGVHSTAQLKYWNHPMGKKVQPLSTYWDELCAYLRKFGYTPVVVEKDEMFGASPFWNGLPKKSNKKIGQSLADSVNLISHCEFYIGLGSGMSWVAHALGKSVVMIANFSEDWCEFDLSCEDYIRITNKSVCHGCWNRINIDYNFDVNDWYWCPEHKGTERQFECHKSITPKMVIDKIQHLLK